MRYLFRVTGSRSNEKPRMLKVGLHNEAVRHSWVAHALGSIPAGARILDAGAGEQPFKKYCSHLHYVSQDFGRYEPADVSTGLQMGTWSYGTLDHVCDIASIPEADGSFDAILCTEVFEHLADPLPALKEFSRLLRSEGTLLLTAPFCSLTHFAPYHFTTGFSRYWYETHLPANGFEIAELVRNGNYFEYLAQELRRVPDVAQRYAQMKPGWFRKLLFKLSLPILQHLSERDNGSDELLCFGYHVKAIKKTATT
jgi:SAM-dependent methyltransferase